MSNTHSTNKYKEFFAIQSEMENLGCTTTRHEFVWNFSKSKHDSITELSPFAYKEFILWMHRQLQDLRQAVAPKETVQKRKVIALFCQMGYVKDEKADMIRINEWCTTHGHKKAHLNGYSGKDLTKLVNQADLMYKSFIKGL